MRHRGPPLWLLRDIPAMAAMIASLWTLIWQMLLTAFIAERNKRPASQSEIALVFGLLARAEEALKYALTRQAYRLIGFDTRSIERVLLDPPTDLGAFNTRFSRYITCLLNLDAAARGAANELAHRYRLCPLRRAARATSPSRFATEGGKPPAPLASLTCNASGGGGSPRLRGETEGAVSTRPNARGPPRYDCRLPMAHCLSAPVAPENASACPHR